MPLDRVARDDLRGGEHEVRAEGRQRQGDELRGPVVLLRRHRRQQDARGHHGAGADGQEVLRREAGHQERGRGGREHGADGEGLDLHRGRQEALGPDGQVPDEDVPREDAEAHQGEEDDQHQRGHGGRGPDVEGEDGQLGHFRFPEYKGREVEDGDE